MSGLFAGIALLATLSLEDARGLAQRNIEVRVAAIRVQQAEEQRRVARSAVLPRVAVRAEIAAQWVGPQRYTSTFPTDAAGQRYERQSVDMPGFGQGVFSLGVGISQLLYDGGRFWNDISRTGALLEAEKGRLSEQRLAVMLETDRLYLDVWRVERTRDVLDRAVEHAKDQRKRAEAQFEFGRAQRRDVIDAELNHANDELRRVRHDALMANARSALAAWLLLPNDGFALAPLAAIPAPSATAPHAPTPNLTHLLAQARARRPLLGALIREREAAENQIVVSRSPLFPRITAEVGYQRQGNTANPFFTDPAKQNSLQGGIVLTWNIFDGFGVSAAVAHAKLELEQVKLETRRAELRIEMEIWQAFALHRASTDAHRIAERSRVLAAEDLKLAEQRFDAGTGGTLEIRDAQVKWLEVELNAIDAEVDVRLARSTLVRVVGGE